jgi:integrase
LKANVKAVLAAGPGRHHIEKVPGLILHVGQQGNRRWIYRFHFAGHPNETGLGSMSDTSLAGAIERATELRAMVRRGVDPIADKRARRQQQTIDGTTFRDVLQLYGTAFATRNGAQDVVALVTRHGASLMGMPIERITVDDIERVVEPVNRATPKTGRRLLSSLSIVFSFAKAKRLREGDDPAAWATWKFLIPPPPPADHYRSMPFAQLPDFYRRLLMKGSVTALALAWTIATAARQSETTGMTWTDLDLERALWVVPAHKIKMRREHRCPLSDAALDVLDRVRALDLKSDYVFPGLGGSRLSSRAMQSVAQRQLRVPYSVHAFRASFSTWAHDRTAFDHETIEACLAHVVGNSVSRAYNRGDAVERRRPLMNAWSAFVDGAQGEQGERLGPLEGAG